MAEKEKFEGEEEIDPSNLNEGQMLETIWGETFEITQTGMKIFELKNIKSGESERWNTIDVEIFLEEGYAKLIDEAA